ncbi:hypothetical protein D3H65_29755 [Paraflavitalea soli]|uniref:Uncharacterized protein n=1 Tax=Paraflavitalea soli TaxID=2315862 RepID=A0A3B7MWT3_9BACT|nr:hypothetical protein [Paraflavitalea soli]AXY77923.1 hypothetical protein D3H65_29755 [Paraflavitalea soli]
MAKYESVVTIRGTIDDLTFRHTAEGKIVGKKTGPTRERVLTHENFELTRTNAREFKQAIMDATLLRRALGGMLDGVRCTTLNGHMNGLLHKAGQADKQHRYGSRCAAGGDVSVLTGFDLNKKLSLDTVLRVRPTHSLDATTGKMNIQIAPFIAYKRKGYPKEATHIRMVSGAVLVNFSNDSYSNNIQRSELLPLSRKTPGAICLEYQINGKPGDVLVQVMGIQLYKLVDGEEVLVKGGAVKILEALRKGNEAEREEGNEASRHQGNEGECAEEEKRQEVARIPETRIESKLHETIEEYSEATRQAAYAEGSSGEEPACGDCADRTSRIYKRPRPFHILQLERPAMHGQWRPRGGCNRQRPFQKPRTGTCGQRKCGTAQCQPYKRGTRNEIILHTKK